MVTVIDSRRDARTLTFCRRHSLSDSVRKPSQAFLRDLNRQDPLLEAYWHPVREHWILYRCVKRGVVPSEDMLMKELDVLSPQGSYRPLGPWLLEWLRKHDKTRNGSVCPDYASSKYLRDIFGEEDRHEQKFQDSVGEMSHNFARDCEKSCLRAPFSQDVSMSGNQTRRTRRKRKK